MLERWTAGFLLRLVAAAPLFLTLGLLQGCDWMRTLGLADSRLIAQRSATLTLSWDPPLTDLPGQPTEVRSYEVYYRRHGVSAWSFLGESPASRHPTFTVEHSLLGDGLYDFAVQALEAGGRASALHSSLDSFAQPISGWYVFWRRAD